LTVARAAVRGPYALRRLQYVAWALSLASPRRFDAVVTRDLGVAAALLRLPRRRRPPIVFESHGYAPVFAATIGELVLGSAPAPASKIARLERRERLVWTRADGYISTTRVLVDDLTVKWGARAHVTVIPNGVRVPAIRQFPPAPPPGPPVVGYAGHLYPWKGSDVFLHAIALVEDGRGLVIGGHPQENDWRRVHDLAARLGIADRVTFAGFVPVGEVIDRLHDAAILVVPTTATASARYTSPLKLFEYMCAGRPIVASDLPSIREIIVHGRNGLLATAGDAAALTSAIRRLLDEPALGHALARQAFDDVAQYSWERRASRVSEHVAAVTAPSRRW
jgi:glycosyltransferase involved in cell wall biosynthesis